MGFVISFPLQLQKYNLYLHQEVNVSGSIFSAVSYELFENIGNFLPAFFIVHTEGDE